MKSCARLVRPIGIFIQRFSHFTSAGSPFPYTVGPIHEGGFARVEVGGLGLERGEVGSLSKYCLLISSIGFIYTFTMRK